MNPRKEDQQTHTNGVAARSRPILFVEDEDAISEPFSQALEREGFEPVVAATAAGRSSLAERCRARPRPARPQPARRRRPRRLPRAAPALGRADRDAHRPRHRDRPDRRARARAPTTTSSSRSARGEVISRIRAVLRRAGVRGEPEPPEPVEVGELELDVAARRATLDGERAGADAQGVRPARRARAPRGRGRHPRGPDVAGLGRQLVRLDEDARRPHPLAAQEARRRPRRTRVHRDRARRRLPLRRSGGSGP